MRDANLYTLLIRPSSTTPSGTTTPSSHSDVIHLVERREGSEEPRYTRVRKRVSEDKVAKGVDPGAYEGDLLDAHTGAKLASVSASNFKAKNKKLQLHSPDVVLGFESTGTLSFEWTFTFEDQQFRWRRELFGPNDFSCVLDRRPDPAVEICISKAPSKGKDGWIQLLDYNIQRFEIKDAKGLELALYISLISLMDGLDDRLAQRDGPTSPGLVKPSSSRAVSENSVFGKPNGKSAKVDNSENPNEVTVEADGSIAEYAARCVSLLGDPSIVLVVIKSKGGKATGKAVEVADATKRARHRAGLDQEGPGLYQYVIDEPEPSSTGPKVIDLNDKKDKRTWTPPTNIAIYLSKIDLPDLNPARRAAARSNPPAPVIEHRKATGGLHPPPLPGSYPGTVNATSNGNTTGGLTPKPGSARPKSNTEETLDAVGNKLSRLFRSRS